MEEKTHKGALTISRITSTNEADFVQISLIDGTSHTLVCQIKMSINEFGSALLNMSHRPCEFDLISSVVGKKHEHKTELVPTPNHSFRRSIDLEDKLLSPFQVDGWIGRRDDLHNGHRHSQKDGQHFQRVTFVRYVDAED